MLIITVHIAWCISAMTNLVLLVDMSSEACQ